MQLTNIPGKLVLPFANSGAKNTIPVASQIGITAGAASLTDGFPPLTRTPKSAGGKPPSGLDMNGILYELSAILRWANAGGGYPYDSTFANDSNVNGYPKGARVLRADGAGYWFNTVDNNETDPDAGGAGWVPEPSCGVATVAMASANVTLTPAQYSKPVIVISGTLTANLQLIFPVIGSSWLVINNTTGAFTITAKTAAGTGVVVRSAMQVVCDGTNIQAADDAAAVLGLNVATAGGTADAITATISPAPRSWFAISGVPFFVRAAAANATATPTIAAGALAAKTIVKGAGAALVAGDIAGAGHWLVLQYDATLDKVVLLNPAFGVLGGRIRLLSNLTMYVSTTGSNSNSGLSAGAPFLTIQKAWDTLASNYDLNGHTVTIQLADGTYSAGLNASGLLVGQTGPGGVIVKGNLGTPANCVISTTAASGIYAAGAQLSVQGVKFLTTTSGNAISAISFAIVYFSTVDFGAMASGGIHVLASSGASVQATGNYTISGGAYAHWNAATNSNITVSGFTVTLTGVPAFSYAFAAAITVCSIYCPTNTFTGTATGARYQGIAGGVIYTGGGGATYLPGNAAGATSSGGQYV